MNKENYIYSRVFLGVIIFIIMVNPCFSVQREAVISPQYNMVGARFLALGGAVPTIHDDINGVFLNPASISDLSAFQLSVNSQRVLDAFDYKMLSLGTPYKGYVFSFSYGSDILGGINQTTLEGTGDDSRIYDVEGGVYQSGFQIYHLGMARTQKFNFWLIDRFSYGLSLKALQQVLGSSSRISYGLDGGFILSFFIPKKALVEKIHLGLSVLNLMGTDLPSWTVSTAQGDSKGSSNPMARQFFLGTRVEMLENKLNLFSGIMGVQSIDELSIGAEYQMTKEFLFRSSILVNRDNSSKLNYNLGTSLLLEDIARFNYNYFDMRLDYTYATHSFPFDGDTTHMIGVSFLGNFNYKKPVLTFPENGYLTNKPSVLLTGRAEPNTSVIIYNNGVEAYRVLSNKYGNWRVSNFILTEGENSIYLKVPRRSDLSQQTKSVLVIKDSTKPFLNILLGTGRSTEVVQLKFKSSENISSVDIAYDNKKVSLKKGLHKPYTLILPERFQTGSYLPEKMMGVSVNAKDSVGNMSQTYTHKLLLEFAYPKDKSIVYNNKITLRGEVSSLITELTVNGEVITLNKNNRFLETYVLDYGKNLLTIQAKNVKGQVYTYYARILAIKKFPDLEKNLTGRRDIEFLATMGFLQPREDGLFYPQENLTRRDVVRLLASIKNLNVEKPSFAPFLDVSQGDPDSGYVLAAVNNGLMFVYPDGTFQLDKVLTVREAHDLLINNDIIESDKLVIDTQLITRYEFAMMLKKIQMYDERLEYLADWEKGFK